MVKSHSGFTNVEGALWKFSLIFYIIYDMYCYIVLHLEGMEARKKKTSNRRKRHTKKKVKCFAPFAENFYLPNCIYIGRLVDLVVVQITIILVVTDIYILFGLECVVVAESVHTVLFLFSVLGSPNHVYKYIFSYNTLACQYETRAKRRKKRFCNISFSY